MKSYLVGGAVRDELLGLTPKERDFVVVGETPEAMLAQGFKPVGKDFPVFLHPETKEEYALARTERKSGRGYHGFTFHAVPDVTLEQDLKRRDLTINAIARNAAGDLIDPFCGADDVENRVLRHVSNAFIEDPVRILRLARFMARFAPLGFTVADETMALMRQMVANGECEHLVAERVWQETRRALGEAAPRAFIETLRACGALKVIYPEVDALFGVPQRAEWHPEVDTGVHLLLVLDQAASLSADTPVRFAALMHDLGKGITPEEILPSHRGHEHKGVPLVKRLCQRLKVPRDYQQLAEMTCREHLNCHRALELTAKGVMRLLERTDALRRPERFEQLLLACKADARGRTGFETSPYSQADYLRRCMIAAKQTDIQELIDAGFEGQALGDKIRAQRIDAIKEVSHET